MSLGQEFIQHHTIILVTQDKRVIVCTLLCALLLYHFRFFSSRTDTQYRLISQIKHQTLFMYQV